MTAPASLSNAEIRDFAASRNANGPTPQNRSAMCFARLQCSDTSAASLRSPATVACRNEPGGKVTRAAPITIVGGRDLDVERLSARYQRLGNRPSRIERAAQAGIENGAAIEGNDVVRIGRRKTDLQHLMCADPGV